MVQGASISVRIVQKVAKREGVDPTTLTPPLHDVVNTDALDDLYRSSGDRPVGTFEFTYRDHTIRIDPAGRVHVDPPTPTRDSEIEPAAGSSTD